MRRRLIQALVGIACLLVLVWSQSEERWYRAQAKRLRALQVTPAMLAAARPWHKHEGTRKGTGSMPCVWSHGQGLIPFSSGEWLYVVSHSSHENELWWGLRDSPLRERLGRWLPVTDAAMVLDSKGRLHTLNRPGHICGGLTLWSEKEPGNAGVVLKAALPDGQPRWIPWDP